MPFIIIAIVIILDIVTKYLANILTTDITIIPAWFTIHTIYNTGVAFGTPLPGIQFIIPIILLIVTIYLIRQWSHMPPIERLGYCLIITGGSLNAIERAIFGFVTDFFSLRYFAVFNVADIAITCGVVLLLWHSIFRNTPQK